MVMSEDQRLCPTCALPMVETPVKLEPEADPRLAQHPKLRRVCWWCGWNVQNATTLRDTIRRRSKRASEKPTANASFLGQASRHSRCS
jgi:hypothetical protein